MDIDAGLQPVLFDRARTSALRFAGINQAVSLEMRVDWFDGLTQFFAIRRRYIGSCDVCHNGAHFKHAGHHGKASKSEAATFGRPGYSGRQGDHQPSRGHGRAVGRQFYSFRGT